MLMCFFLTRSLPTFAPRENDACMIIGWTPLWAANQNACRGGGCAHACSYNQPIRPQVHRWALRRCTCLHAQNNYHYNGKTTTKRVSLWALWKRRQRWRLYTTTCQFVRTRSTEWRVPHTALRYVLWANNRFTYRLWANATCALWLFTAFHRTW